MAALVRQFRSLRPYWRFQNFLSTFQWLCPIGSREKAQPHGALPLLRIRMSGLEVIAPFVPDNYGAWVLLGCGLLADQRCSSSLHGRESADTVVMPPLIVGYFEVIYESRHGFLLGCWLIYMPLDARWWRCEAVMLCCTSNTLRQQNPTEKHLWHLNCQNSRRFTLLLDL